MKLIVTGFDRFGDWSRNPSERLVEMLGSASTLPADVALDARMLPTAYARAGAAVESLIETRRPDFLLCLGLAAGRGRLSLERFALNVDDATLADNDGVVRRGETIAPGGPAALRARADLEAPLAALLGRGLRAEISNHAGTFVCNHVYYRALRAIERIGLDTDCLFLHLPSDGERAPSAAADLPPREVGDLHRAVLTVIEVVLARRRAGTASAQPGSVAAPNRNASTRRAISRRASTESGLPMKALAPRR